MSNPVEISIIIPHFNSPLKLRRLLSSIPDIEELQVIVVDDNSNTYVEEYTRVVADYNQRVEFYSNELMTKGAGGARNEGLQHAEGKWVLFADADDFFIEGFWLILKKYIHRSEDVIFFPPLAYWESTHIPSSRYVALMKLALDLYTSPAKKKRVNELKIRQKWPTPGSKLIKKTLIDKYNIRFELVKYSNDLMFSAQVGLYANEVYATYEPIYIITEAESGTLTKNDDPEMAAIREEVLDRVNRFWNVHGHKDAYSKEGAYAKLLKYLRENQGVIGEMYSYYRKIRYK